MGSGTSPDYCAWHFCPGDRVRHSRLGTGRVLWQQQNGTLVIRFDGKSKADVLFPFQFERVQDTDNLRHPVSVSMLASVAPAADGLGEKRRP